MAIIWTTPSGSLGTIDERVSYSKTLLATNATSFSLLAGSMPSGLYVASGGEIKGTPSEVANDTTSKFVVRATDGTTSADRTFKLTVRGPDAPAFSTPAGTVLSVTDGEYIDTTIVATDIDNNIIKYYQADGVLPPGVSFNQRNGKLTGIVSPLQVASDTRQTGWDMNPFDQLTDLWDDIYRSKSVSRYYPFKVRVTDGETEDARQFDIYVASADEYRADTTDTTADGLYGPNSSITVTADRSSNRKPVFTTPSGLLGTFTHENYHIVKLDITDPDADLLAQNVNTISFTLSSGTLPAGMTLDSSTGEIYGTLDTQIANETTYEFSVKAQRTTEGSRSVSTTRAFSIKVQNDRANAVSWTTPVELVI